MSVTQITNELEAMQTAFENFKAGCSMQFKKAYDLENEFMNAFEDLNSYVSSETTKLLNTLFKHTEFVNTFKREYDTNKFEEGNFNRVSIIKKQDDTIKTLEIKVAELEMRLASAEKNQSRQTVSSVKDIEQPIPTPTQPEQIEHQCYARVGKAKYNISKQAPDFMTEFPEGSFITKTGCVVGLPCATTVTHTNVLFCSEHNSGKFEDIRTEPGTPQAPITQIPTAVSVEQQQVEKKKPSTRKKKDQVITAPEPVAVVTAPEPVVVVDVTTPEPVVVVDVAAPEPVVTAPEPVAVITAPEPVAVVTAPEPVVVVDVAAPEPVVTAPEPVAVITAPEPVAVITTPEPVAVITAPEPVAVVTVPALNLTFDQEDTPDTQSPPLSPVVDISTINQTKEQVTAVNIQESEMCEPVQNLASVIEPPSFDDIEFYDDPTTGKTYYLDSKTKRIFEIAPNDEIGVFVKQL